MTFDNTSALEIAIKKEKNQSFLLKFKMLMQSLWLQTFRHQESPANSARNSEVYFIVFALLTSLDLLLTGVMTANCIAESGTFGLPYLYILPFVACVAPVWGSLGCVSGSVRILSQYSDLNATLIVMTFPLQIIMMTWLRSASFYFGIIII